MGNELIRLTDKDITEQDKVLAEEQFDGNWMPYLMDMQLGRNYLNNIQNPKDWKFSITGFNDTMGWLQIDRLPMDDENGYHLLQAWQSVLSACHTLGLKVAFVLHRFMGETKLYLGAVNSNGNPEKDNACAAMQQCVSVHLPGAVLQKQETGFSMTKELNAISVGNFTGVITGIPSLQGRDNQPLAQTLDKLAGGITIGGGHKNYALVVIADPAKDAEIIEIKRKLLRIKSELHTLASYSESQGTNTSETEGKSKTRRSGLALILGMVQSASLIFGATGNVLGYAGMSLLSTMMGSLVGDRGTNNTQTESLTNSISKEHKDFTISNCEELIDKHIARMEGGRNLGFWQVGTYVLGDKSETVDAVLALLRSVYSGSESYVEPIRALNTSNNASIHEMITNMRFVPLPIPQKQGEQTDGHWHVLGRMYESLTTPLTTQELSIATSLPHNDVPGLRFVRNGVHFAANPAVVRERENAIVLGKLMDMGTQQITEYAMDVHALVRHTLVAGSTGSGKSTTCKRILSEVLNKGIPVLIVEPAKDDYVNWALEMNKNLPEEKRFTIYMPGADEYNGESLPPLRLNPFEPAAYKDSKVRIQQHSEHFATLLNACLPSEDVIPILIDESVQFCIRVKADNAGISIDEPLNEQMKQYPTMVSLYCAGNTIIRRKTYAQQTKDSFEEILRTRFSYLQRGTRGSILNTPKSVNFDDLFSRPTVINLSCLAGSKDKALIMSLLLLALYEYRQSRYANDADYRAEAKQNHLKHLMLIEEAHNVLTRPAPTVSGGSPEQAAADLFTNMLSEVRSYGQGIMIVDQVPTRLIEDAIKNTNYKIAHRLASPDDIEVMARSMGLNEEQQKMLASLEIGHAIVRGDQDDGPTWVKMDF